MAASLTTVSGSVLGLVSPQSVTLYWYVVRGSGFVAYLLLTVAVTLGLLLSLRWRTDRWPRFLTEQFHQFLQLVAGIFLVVHIVSTLLDSFVHFEVYQVLVPFTGQYRVIWLSLGIIAAYLGIAIALSTYVRRFIGYRAWRMLHYAGFGAWSLALIHSIATGTDTRSRWALAVYVVSALVVAGLMTIRFGGIPVRLGTPPQFRPRVVLGILCTLLLGAALTAIGPLRSGWAAAAGSVAGPTSSVSGLPPRTFQDTISGTTNQKDSQYLNPGFGLLDMKLSGTGDFPVQLEYGLLLQGGPGGNQFVRGVFSMAPTGGGWNCSGTASFQPPNQLESTCTLPPRRQLDVVVTFRIDALGRATGNLTASPQMGSPGTG